MRLGYPRTGAHRLLACFLPTVMAAWIAKRPKVLLFGDSITARSFDSMGWGASLAHYYMRKADVVNRGRFRSSAG